MSAQDGGRAFPRTADQIDDGEVGMTLRDYFAAAALQGMLCNGFMPNQVGQSSDKVFNYTKAAFA